MIYTQEVSIFRYKFGLSAIVIHYNTKEFVAQLNILNMPVFSVKLLSARIILSLKTRFQTRDITSPHCETLLCVEQTGSRVN